MALVLTGTGTISGTVTNVDVNIRYNVDAEGVDSLIDTICDRKEDVSDCVVYGEVKGGGSFDICSPVTPIAPYTEEILKIVSEGFTNPCKAPNPGAPCDFSVAGSFAASLSAGFGASLSVPCGIPVPSLPGRSVNGQPSISICGEAFEDFRVGVEIYSKNMLGSVAEILRAVCEQKGSVSIDGRGSIGACILPEVYASFQGSVTAILSAALEAAADILQNICYGDVSLDGAGFSCLNVSAGGRALGQAAEDFGCFMVQQIAEAVAGGGSISICGQGCGWNACDMAKGLITNCDLACYAFEQLIEKDCFKDYIEKFLKDNQCQGIDILGILLPDEGSCADAHVLDWFAGALDREDEKKCPIFNKFIEEDGTAKECITDSILAWMGKDENPCKIMEAIVGKIGVTEKAKEDNSCVNNYIVDYVDAQTNDILYSIFTNNQNPSKYSGRGARTSGNNGYKKNLRNGVLNFVQDETCAIFTALTNGLQGKPTLQDFIDAATRGDWYAFYFLGQGATADKCVNEFDNFIDAVFCRVAKKIVDRAKANSCPSGDNSDCIVEVARALYGLIIANFGVPGTFSVEGECKQAKFLVDLKSDFVQDRAFCSAPTKDDIKYLS
jgi:hypothetical protein